MVYNKENHDRLMSIDYVSLYKDLHEDFKASRVCWLNGKFHGTAFTDKEKHKELGLYAWVNSNFDVEYYWSFPIGQHNTFGFARKNGAENNFLPQYYLRGKRFSEEEWKRRISKVCMLFYNYNGGLKLC